MKIEKTSSFAPINLLYRKKTSFNSRAFNNSSFNLIYKNNNKSYKSTRLNTILRKKNRVIEQVLDKDIIVVPLGGLGEIGMNCMLIGSKKRFILIDCGIMFTDLSHLGIQKVIPDINFLTHIQNLIEGLIITHGHEDHIGAINWVLPILRSDALVYTSRFVYNIISKRIDKQNYLFKKLFRIFDLKKRFQLGPFECEAFRVTHSIPDCCGFVIRSKYGLIVHTGDWKIDEFPLDGEKFDREFLESISKEKVLLMMSDSTNSLSHGRTASEKVVQDSLVSIITNPKIKGRIITTQFASNVFRLYSIKKAADISKRKICFLGTSLNSYLDASLLDGRAPFHPSELVQESELKNIDPDKIIIVTTGSQGEARSTLNLSSLDLSPRLSLNPYDTIIYSAKIIPGNDKKVVRMLNRISSHGCKIIYGNQAKIHTSGHAYEDELKEILKIVKPSYFLPVHGELISLNVHSTIALQNCGIKNTIVMRNGQVLSLESDNQNPLGFKLFNLSGEINLVNHYNTGSSILGSYADIGISDKIKISNEGIILISLEFVRIKESDTYVSFKSKLRISSRGIWIDRGKLNFIIKKLLFNILNKCRTNISIISLEQIISETMNYSCYKINRSNPEIIVYANELTNI